jgi:serine/threonine protein kinase
MKVEYQGKKYKLKKIKQKAGVILGEGGFGCVVSPPLKCQSPFFKAPFSIDKDYVSKIVEYDEDDEDILNELKFGRQLSKIDPRQRYFSPIINGCLLEEQKHQDIEYLSESNVKKDFFTSTSLTGTSDDSESDNKCKIYLTEDYLNLISKNSGIDFGNAMKSNNPSYIKYFKQNYKAIMHHFCDAVMMLHRINILHRDLKPANIMILLKPERNKATLNIIDFGLSEELKGKYTLPQMRYLVGAGTHYYTPLEIFILDIMIKEIRKNKNIVPSNFKSVVLTKVSEKYNKYRNYYLEDFYFAKDGFVYDSNKLNRTINRKYKPRYANKSDRYKVFYHLLKDINNNVLVQNFTGHMGHIFKWDVFSLGLIFAEMIVKCNIEDAQAFDLVNKMVNCKYWERYDIKECLNHPFFGRRMQSRTKKMTTKHHVKNMIKSKRNIRYHKPETHKFIAHQIENKLHTMKATDTPTPLSTTPHTTIKASDTLIPHKETHTSKNLHKEIPKEPHKEIPKDIPKEIPKEDDKSNKSSKSKYGSSSMVSRRTQKVKVDDSDFEITKLD